MAPLDAAATAAVKAKLSKRHGRHHLPANVVAKLVQFFTGRGESLVDLPLDVDDDDVDAWEKLWGVIAEDAGVDVSSDRLRVVQYLHVRSKPASGATRDATGVANVAIMALEANGVAISSEAAAAMQNALAVAEAEVRAASSAPPMRLFSSCIGGAQETRQTLRVGSVRRQPSWGRSMAPSMSACLTLTLSWPASRRSSRSSGR